MTGNMLHKAKEKMKWFMREQAQECGHNQSDEKTKANLHYTAGTGAAAVPVPSPLLPLRLRALRADNAWPSCRSISTTRLRATATSTEAVNSRSERMALGGLRFTLSSELLQQSEQRGACGV